MILKGSQRGGANQLSSHLLNSKDNDHVSVFELRGFVSDDLKGALSENHAIAKGTKCEQFMFSLSLNPPQNENVSEADFAKTADLAEERLGLKDQPRAIVFHEKEGRRHAHVVWSRIDPETMRAINLPHFKYKLTALSRELYLEHGWNLPDGLRRDGGKSPLNFTLEEWQQAKRQKLDPREIKQVFQETWSRTDTANAFKNALEEKGYFLARGDRRGFVALNVGGEVFAIPKWVGIKTKEVRAKLGKESELESVDQVRSELALKVTNKVTSLMRDVKSRHDEELRPLVGANRAMAKAHQSERQLLSSKQEKRWNTENAKRADKLNKGLRGLWQKVTGKSRHIQKANEAEAYQGHVRDRTQRDDLVFAQLKERQVLQKDINKIRKRHVQNHRLLSREVSTYLRMRTAQKDVGKDRSQQREHQEQPHIADRKNDPSNTLEP